MALDPNAPAVRAAHLKEDLSSLAVLGPAQAAAVRARLQASTVLAIESAHSTNYLPLALNLELADAVYAVAGDAGSRRWGTASLLASLEGFFKPLLLGLTRLASPSPALMYKTLPQGWSTTYRRCGELWVTRPAETRAVLTGHGVPPEMQTQAFLSAVCGTLEAAFRISRYAGEVTLEPFQPGSGEVTWSVTWKPL